MEEFTTSNKAEDCDKGTSDTVHRESHSHYFNPIVLSWHNGFGAGWSDRVVVVDVDLLTAAEVEIADICLAREEGSMSRVAVSRERGHTRG